MKGTATREYSEIRLLNSTGTNAAPERSASNGKITALRSLAQALLAEVQSLSEVPTLDIKHGIDFYEEIERFEVDLIQRALAYTGGNQVRAARLLNLKVTTLNTKIKNYNINLSMLVGGHIIAEVGRNGARQQLATSNEADAALSEPTDETAASDAETSGTPPE